MSFRKILILIPLSFLTACGGGGGGTSTSQQTPVVTSTNVFNFQSAWQKFNSTNYTKNLTISGSCSGSSTYSRSTVSQPQAFDYSDTQFPHPMGSVNPGYYIRNTEQIKSDFTGCQTYSSNSVIQNYYDAVTFAPYGYIGGTAYNGATSYQSSFKEFSAAVVLPSSLRVGDTGVVGTVYTYAISNFRKYGTPIGQTDVTYVIEADTAVTAIVNVISKVYDSNGKLALIDQTRYQIDSNNNLALSSIDQQYSDSLSTHIIMK